ncbi:MAG TPA: NUDIX domain-containing protein [Acidimicrobiia bacterium]|nr:NUDIX domain-containing protein [Acidimicrobiia bacterium]
MSYQRAVAYLTDPASRLLVFDHVRSADAGTQVPAGGIHAGEAPEAAAMRELVEESGISAARMVRKLGECWWNADGRPVPTGYEEQMHHVFHLHLDAPTAAAEWEWDERDGDHLSGHRFAFRWIDLAAAETQLFPEQAMWIALLRLSIIRM